MNKRTYITILMLVLAVGFALPAQAKEKEIKKAAIETEATGVAKVKDLQKAVEPGEASEKAKDAKKGLEAAATAAANNVAWKGLEPAVVVSHWGTELKIVFTPSPLMKKEEKLAIQSVKLESDKGEFLGLKTYSPEETDRTAEFTVNPEMLKIDAVQVTATSSTSGAWVGKASLILPDPTLAPPAADKAAETAGVVAAEAKTTAGSVPAAAEAPKAKPKKKGWPW